jgi:hypothetical protein
MNELTSGTAILDFHNPRLSSDYFVSINVEIFTVSGDETLSVWRIAHCTATILWTEYSVEMSLNGNNPVKYAHFAYSVWNRVMICVLGELVKLVKLGLD